MLSTDVSLLSDTQVSNKASYCHAYNVLLSQLPFIKIHGLTNRNAGRNEIKREISHK